MIHKIWFPSSGLVQGCRLQDKVKLKALYYIVLTIYSRQSLWYIQPSRRGISPLLFVQVFSHWSLVIGYRSGTIRYRYGCHLVSKANKAEWGPRPKAKV